MEEETMQLNLRMPKRIVEDMDFVSNALKINRSDWFKYKFAELIAHEKEKAIESIDKKYIKGQIDENEYIRLVKISPSLKLKEFRETKFFQGAIEKYLAGAMSDKEYTNIFYTPPSKDLIKKKEQIGKAGKKFFRDFASEIKD